MDSHLYTYPGSDKGAVGGPKTNLGRVRPFQYSRASRYILGPSGLGGFLNLVSDKHVGYAK